MDLEAVKSTGLVLVIALAAGFVYAQRSNLSDQVCRARGDFLGISVSIPADVRAGCTRIRS